MTEHHRTLLDDLDQAHVGSAPVAHLVSGAQAARRRKQRTLVAGAAAVTALAVGGGILTTQALTDPPTNNVADAPGTGQSLDVTVVSGVSESVLDSFAEPLTGAAAAWNPTDETLVYVSGMSYSSSCPPEGTATVVADTKVVTLQLRDYDGTEGCTSDAGRVTVTVDGLTAPPGELTVTTDGGTTTIPVESLAVPSTSSTSLEGTWFVTALIDANGKPLLSGDESPITLTFKDGEMTGNTGCNGIWGEYEQSGNSGEELRFPPRTLGSRLQFCADEPPLLDRLQDVRHASLQPDGVFTLHAENYMIVAQMESTDNSYEPSMPAPPPTTRCDQVQLPESGLGEADFSVDEQRGLLTINFSETRNGTSRNITYTVQYRTDPTCASTPAMADLIDKVLVPVPPGS